MSYHKTLLIDTAPIAYNPTTSHARSAIELAQDLDIDLVSRIEDFADRNPKDYSKIVVFGSAFYPKTAEIEAWIRKIDNPQIIWLNNEHTCSPNSEYARLIKDYDSVVVSNLVERGNKVKGYNKFYHINLNCLLAKPPSPTLHKKYDLVYFGTYRAGRRVYLQKYFADSTFHLSSSKKNLKKFKQLAGCNAIFCDKFDWTHERETFNLFKYTIYLEDELMHVNFNNLSNRFYEAIFCNVVQFFDKSCKNTIAQARMYEVPSYYFVESYEELCEKVATTDFDKALLEQSPWAEIALQERKLVLEQLSEILL